jgi:hypothetical protein
MEKVTFGFSENVTSGLIEKVTLGFKENVTDGLMEKLESGLMWRLAFGLILRFVFGFLLAVIWKVAAVQGTLPPGGDEAPIPEGPSEYEWGGALYSGPTHPVRMTQTAIMQASAFMARAA